MDRRILTPGYIEPSSCGNALSSNHLEVQQPMVQQSIECGTVCFVQSLVLVVGQLRALFSAPHLRMSLDVLTEQPFEFYIPARVNRNKIT